MLGYRIPGGPYPQAFFGVSGFPPYERGELPGAGAEPSLDVPPHAGPLPFLSSYCLEPVSSEWGCGGTRALEGVSLAGGRRGEAWRVSLVGKWGFISERQDGRMRCT